MHDAAQTNAQLINELAELRQKVTNLETAETERKRAEEALRESEERFRRLSEATFEGIIIHEEGKIIDANRSFATMFGYDVSEVIGRNALDFATPGLRDVALRHMRTGSSETYEGVAIRKDGSTFPVEVQAENILYEGRATRVTAIRDITDRKQAEAALRESEARYRAVVDQSVDGIYLVDVRTRCILEANTAFAGMLDSTSEELIGRSIYDFILADREDINKTFQEILRAEGPFTHERQYRRKDGSRLDVWVSGNVISSGGRGVMFTMVRDLTDRKQAEEALRKTEAKFRTVIENIFKFVPEGLVVLTDKLNLFRCNQAFEDLIRQYAVTLNYSEAELTNLLMEQIKTKLVTGEKSDIRIRRKP